MFGQKLFGGERSLLVAHLLEALDGDLCPVCKLAGEAERRYLEILLHERVNDQRTRQQLAEGYGFCVPHTRMLLEVGGYGSHVKIALLYQEQVAALAEAIGQLPDKGQAQGKLQGDCPVCRTVERTEGLYCDMLAHRLKEEEMRACYLSGPSLCLTHFRRTYDCARPSVRSFLRDDQRRRLAAVSRDLGEFVRKSAQVNYAEREAFGEERDVWLRALRLHAGGIEG